MKKSSFSLSRLLLCLMLLSGQSGFAGEKCASGNFLPPAESTQEKPLVSCGKHREKTSSAANITTEEVVVENNSLGNASSEKRDELAEKIKDGDRTLQTNKQYLELENADRRSDELMAKFNKNPNEMSTGEKAELTYYLKVYAAEMSNQYGPEVAKALVTSMMKGESYIKSAPDREAMQKAQTIMNTWGYHSSNASIGDPILVSGGNILGTTIKGAAANVAIGLTANAAVQLKGDEPFSYVDLIMAGTTALFTTGKGVGTSTAINVTGSLVSSQIKGEDPTGSAIGTTFGSVIGGVGGKMLNVVNPVKNQITKDIIGTTTSSVASELTSEAIKSQVNERAKK